MDRRKKRRLALVRRDGPALPVARHEVITAEEWDEISPLVPHVLLTMTGFTGSDIIVYNTLLTVCENDSGACAPSQAWLREMTGLASRTIRHCFVHLESRGMVRVVRPATPRLGNTYVVTGPRFAEVDGVRRVVGTP